MLGVYAFIMFSLHKIPSSPQKERPNLKTKFIKSELETAGFCINVIDGSSGYLYLLIPFIRY